MQRLKLHPECAHWDRRDEQADSHTTQEEDTVSLEGLQQEQWVSHSLSRLAAVENNHRL